MADDTRIAEAYLLLNYSNQSYKEQMLNSSNLERKPLKVVAIHLGVGNSQNETESLHLAKSFCEELMLRPSSFINSTSTSRKKRKNSSQTNNASTITQATESCGDAHKTGFTQLDAESAVVQLIKLMEDHPALNCGYGSNLNIKGQVECDASLMSDKTQVWSGVGAISGCRNPILLAKSLFDHRAVPRPLGLIQPNILVGSGAKQWMREHCPHLTIVDSKLVSSRAFSTYQKLKSRYDSALRSTNQDSRTNYVQSSFDGYSSTAMASSANLAESECSFTVESSSFNNPNQQIECRRQETHSTQLDHGFYCLQTQDNLMRAHSFARAINECRNLEKETNPQDYTERLDTVGAIAVDFENNFAAAISSGGLLMKFKGRVGQAAIPGAGCWAEDSVAVTTTGVGEYLTQTLFAKKFYDKMSMLRLLHDLGHVEKKHDLSDVISCAMEECFEDLMKTPSLAHVPLEERLAGILSISTLNSKLSTKRVDNNDLYLSFGHNCSSMCVGYMTCDDIAAHSIMSRKSTEKVDCKQVGVTNHQNISESEGCSRGTIVRTLKFSLNRDRVNCYYPDNCSKQS